MMSATFKARARSTSGPSRSAGIRTIWTTALPPVPPTTYSTNSRMPFSSEATSSPDRKCRLRLLHRGLHLAELRRQGARVKRRLDRFHPCHVSEVDA